MVIQLVSKCFGRLQHKAGLGMCCNYSICWLPIIKGGKLVWYNVVVTNFCSNFCCKTTRSRENTHCLLTYVVQWSHSTCGALVLGWHTMRRCWGATKHL